MNCEIDHYAFAIMMASFGAGMLVISLAIARSIWNGGP
jgi:hypothetical protein